MNHLIAIDGGGTKTEALFTDCTGRVLARAVVGPSNPNDTSVETSAKTIAEAVRLLLAGSACRPSDCALFAGISGALNHRLALETAIRVSIPDIGAVEVRSDVQILLSAELPVGDGACVICGTGSACFLRMGTDIHRIGGWGYLLDSGGSGYDIGRDALEAALRAHDGRGPATELTSLLANHLSAPVEQSITAIYEGGKPRIASCAPLVFQAAAGGDPVAETILRRNARALAELMEAAYRRLHAREALALHIGDSLDGTMCAERFRVILGGGIAQKEPAWVTRVCQAMDSTIPLELSVASTPPVFGAVFEAARLASRGGTLSEAYLSALRASLTATYSLNL